MVGEERVEEKGKREKRLVDTAGERVHITVQTIKLYFHHGIMSYFKWLF